MHTEGKIRIKGQKEKKNAVDKNNLYVNYYRWFINLGQNFLWIKLKRKTQLIIHVR